MADSGNNTIRQIVISTGEVTTLAGVAESSGYRDYSGSSGSLPALFNFPGGITTDGTNLYVADTNNYAIRQIVISSGLVTTLAGIANSAGSNDGFSGAAAAAVIAADTAANAAASAAASAATALGFVSPTGITTDGTNLYVADMGSCEIRQMALSTGVVTTLAGGYVSNALGVNSPFMNAFSGSGCGYTDDTGTAASFDMPQGITTDGTNLYVADTGNNVIRKIVISTGAVTTLAGNALGNSTIPGQIQNTYSGLTNDPGLGNSGGSNDGTGTAASFNMPQGITTDGTNLYVADTGNNTIRQIVISTGVVTTLAGSASGGSGLPGMLGGNSYGGLPTNGGGLGYTDGTGAAASFNRPMGITTDGTNLYVADTGDGVIRKIVISTGVVTTLAGSANSSSAYGNLGTFGGNSGLPTINGGLIGNSDYTDGTGAVASFNMPQGITTDGTNLYVADTGDNVIRQIVISSGAVTTLTGSTAGWAGETDGPLNVATFASPIGICEVGGKLFVSESGNSGSLGVGAYNGPGLNQQSNQVQGIGDGDIREIQ